MKKAKEKKKRWPYVLLVIFLIIASFTGVVIYNASRNVDDMNRTVDNGMNNLTMYGKMTEIDPGEYKTIKMYGVMKFDVSQYEIEDLGNLSVMKTNMGIMQMVSYVITPYEKNMPMMSMDFMYILGKRKVYIEFYDLVADTKSDEYRKVLEELGMFRDRHYALEDLEVEPAWYDEYMTIAAHKQGDLDDEDQIEELFCDAVRSYMEAASKLDKLKPEQIAEKQKITQDYCDTLVEQGGVSTDVFKKSLGEDKTKEFFDKVMFGPQLYE